MKLFNEYTSEELLKLTEEQIDDLAKLELIKDGESLPYEKPQIETLETIDAPHLTIYTVALNKKFARKEDAENLINSIKGAITTRSHWTRGGYIEHTNEEVLEDDKYSPEIKTEKVYKTSDTAHIAQILDRNKNIQGKIDAWKDVMDKYYEERGKITAAIWDVQKSNNEKAERDIYMAECLRLADNDKIIAARFFEKRYPNENKSESQDF